MYSLALFSNFALRQNNNMSVKLSFKVFKAGKQGRRKDNSTILEFYGNFVNHVSNILSFEMLWTQKKRMNFEQKKRSRAFESFDEKIFRFSRSSKEKCNTFKMSGKVSRYKIHRYFLRFIVFSSVFWENQCPFVMSKLVKTVLRCDI